MSDDEHGITLEAVEDTLALIAPHIVETPVVEWSGPEMRAILPGSGRVHAKLELFQRSGTFKARGALSNVLRLNAEQLRAGVTAMSAGNHAIAVAHAAKAAGTSAKVVMQRSANPARVDLARALGAEIPMAEDGPSGFEPMATMSTSRTRGRRRHAQELQVRQPGAPRWRGHHRGQPCAADDLDRDTYDRYRALGESRFRS